MTNGTVSSQRIVSGAEGTIRYLAVAASRLIALGASAVLLTAGIAKCLDSSSLEVVLREVYGVARGGRLLSVLLGGTEIFVALLLLVPATVRVALLLAASLAAFFLMSVTFQWAVRPDLACGCAVWGGPAVSGKNIVFNTAFFLVLLLAIVLSRDRRGIQSEISS